MMQYCGSKVSWPRVFCLAVVCLLMLSAFPGESHAATASLGSLSCKNITGTFGFEHKNAQLRFYIDDDASLYVAYDKTRGYIKYNHVSGFIDALQRAKNLAVVSEENGLTRRMSLFKCDDGPSSPVEISFDTWKGDYGQHTQLIIQATDFDNIFIDFTAYIDSEQFDELLQIIAKYPEAVRKLQQSVVGASILDNVTSDPRSTQQSAPQQSGSSSTSTSGSNSNVSVAPTLPPNMGELSYEAQCKQMTKGYIKDITIRGTGYILGTNVNLRDAHSTKSNVITRMQNGQEVQYLRYYDDETPWYYIRLKNGQCGWCNGDFVDSRWSLKRMGQDPSKLTMTERIHIDVWKRFRTPGKFRSSVKENISSTRTFRHDHFDENEAHVIYELSAPGIKAIYSEGSLDDLTVTAKGVAPFGSLDITSTKEQVLQKLGQPRLIEIDGKRYYFENVGNGKSIVYCDGNRKDNMTITELFNMGGEAEYEFTDTDDDRQVDRILFKFNANQQVVSMRWYCMSD